MIAALLATVLRLIGPSLFGRVLDHMERRAASDVDRERIEATRQAEQARAYRDIAVAESGFLLSATRIGRLLIVVPFGIWWAAIFLDSIFGFSWNVLALPERIQATADFLIPAIVVADAGERGIRTLAARRR